jgi:ABC-type cobalt transport system substrate-binding protein
VSTNVPLASSCYGRTDTQANTVMKLIRTVLQPVITNIPENTSRLYVLFAPEIKVGDVIIALYVGAINCCVSS